MRLKKKDSQSLSEFKKEVLRKFPGAYFILFGSKAKGKDTEFSDMDVLVILKRRISTQIEKRIFEIGFEVGLKHDTVFGIVVEEKGFWGSSLAQAMPFYKNVAKEGIVL